MADTVDLDAAKPDVRYWLGQIEAAQKWHTDWHDRGKDVVDRYMDKKSNNLAATDGHKMNVLWSNVQTIQPALYAKTANPSIQRRFRDKDPVGRWAATVLERCEAYELDAYDDDYHYRQCILDYLLPGRGQNWVYYKPTISGGTDLRAQKLEWECCEVRHIHWRDFLTNPARTWDEVWWVAKREYMTKEEATAQRLDVSKLTFTDQKDDTSNDNINNQASTKKAAVWEIWSKTHGKVFFVSKLCPELLRPAGPPNLKFEGFFPCPRPLTATTTTDSILPVPDFCQYQNQAQEIDRLSQRINLLTKALRVAGVYDASQETLGNLLNDTDNNVLLPCETYAVLAAQGGIEGSISLFPLKEIIAALNQCYISREQAKSAMYEITGISDIVRGASDPNETLGAQEIKSQWGGLRIKDRQKEVQRFIRDTMRLKAEIHAEQFQPTTLKTMSNVPLADEATKKQLGMRQQAQQMASQNPQMAQQAMQANPQLQALAKPLTSDEQQMLKEPSWEQVVQLLKSDKLRGFRIDIETDSTVATDEIAEKQSRTEFVTATTSFISAWGPIVAQQPKTARLAGEILLFATRAYKCADSLEGVIEEFVESMEQQPPPPPPGADQSKMAMVQVQAKKNDSDAQLKNKEIETKASTALQVEGMKVQGKLQGDAMAREADAQQAHQDRAFQAQDKAQDRAFTAQESQQDRSLQAHSEAQSHAVTSHNAAQDREATAHGAAQDRHHDAAKHQSDAAQHEHDAQREDKRERDAADSEQETSGQVIKAIGALGKQIEKLSARVDKISKGQSAEA